MAAATKTKQGLDVPLCEPVKASGEGSNPHSNIAGYIRIRPFCSGTRMSMSVPETESESSRDQACSSSPR